MTVAGTNSIRDELNAAIIDAAGDLVDALHDELCLEVGQNVHVLEHVERLCRLLNGGYIGYVGSWL